MSLVELDNLFLSRNAFSPRDVARAGDLWRLIQDAAVLGSCELGWDPARYRRENCAFVVRKMTVVHRRELDFGEPIRVRTWVSSFRGARFSDRQVRVEIDGRTVCGATQEWLHVSSPAMRITRASAALLEAFSLHDLGPDEQLPEVAAPVEGPVHLFAFEAWHTWMDPLAHANHPLYVDWIDEALGRVLAGAGHDPHDLVPIAESISWKQGVSAPSMVRVETQIAGRSADGGVHCAHRILSGDTLCATATTVRGHAVDHDRLASALARGLGA